jgi:hypothetical protein
MGREVRRPTMPRKDRGERKKPVVYVGEESVKEFNQRLHREKRYLEFQLRVAELQEKEGLKYAEARQRLAPEFGPGGQPSVVEKEKPTKAPMGRDWSYYEVLDWVCKTLGRQKRGHEVKSGGAPNDQAWAIFCWAGSAPEHEESFYKMWISESRRQTATVDEENREGKKQRAELEQMLREVAEEATASELRVRRGMGKAGENLPGGEGGDPE